MTIKGGYLKAPCKDCKERHLGCHDRCSRYQEYKKSNEEKNKYLRDLKERK